MGLLVDQNIGQGGPQSNHILAVQNTGNRKISGLVKHKHTKRPRDLDKKHKQEGGKELHTRAARKHFD